MTTSTSRPAVPPRSRSAAGTRRRKPGRRGRLALAIFLSLLLLLAAGAGWVYLKLDGDIKTFDAGGIADNRPSAGSSKGENVLVIGSDARNDGNAALGGGDVNDIGRSDTAFLLHIYADHKNAVAVSIPRDTLVTIPPCKLPDGKWTTARRGQMFNEAFSVGETAKGNPACTQNTVESITGLRVDHTVVVDFKGFAALTDVVGGVKVCLPQDLYQRDLNPNLTTRGKLLFDKGEQEVSGQKALDYVRIRHGIGDGSDIGRIKRQQAFVASLLKEVKSNGLSPTKLLPLADAATKSLTVDPGLGSADKLISFAMTLKDIDLHNTKFVTIPWRYAGDRVAIVEPDASDLWAALKADRTLDGKDASGKKKAAPSAGPSAAPTPVSGKGITVTVYNGTTVTGLAAKAAAELTSDGFTVTGTATARSQDHATTVIEYGPGHKSEAQTAARVFPGAAMQPVPGAGVNVVVGKSYKGGSTAAPKPTAIPKDVTEGARSADDNPCSNLTYG
ncbi:LCP family protein [Streptomyces turgidiscabies]|uniref:Putative transcriptional regulator n=1 Tax=Streptomyces turgidiscabies (strain Car8) TaxID=698760 RepID=L7F8C4_STRT8|nr:MULTISPECIES: LCP family protein [Streptomyces]ELP67477.1 putative transcriptional regulator [Streptomyces turgidiscabies Car8]MDX3495097.1 LCP family protein [Streptomyces turgidiscabies]GAQ70970.1 putative transcriptional regulator YvhJ [Streptomyces turgidiscabies]